MMLKLKDVDSMSELLKAVIDQVEPFLLKHEYLKKGGNDFVRKEKENGREEVISFSSRKGRGEFSNCIYIGVTSGIYFKKINSLDKKIIKDFMNSYPIISGSIGHYKVSEPEFISIPINNLGETESIGKLIIINIEQGAFNLFETYPDLNSIALGIEKEDEWLKDYTKFLDFRKSIRVASIYRIEKGKEFAISWFSKLSLESEKKQEAINAMEKEW